MKAKCGLPSQYRGEYFLRLAARGLVIVLKGRRAPSRAIYFLAACVGVLGGVGSNQARQPSVSTGGSCEGDKMLAWTATRSLFQFSLLRRSSAAKVLYLHVWTSCLLVRVLLTVVWWCAPHEEAQNF